MSCDAAQLPSAWVQRFSAILPAGEVLDLACGSGRHVRLLAGQGRPVLAVDRNLEALNGAALPGVSLLEADLEAEAPAWPASLFASGRYAGIVVTNYLHRPLFPLLFDSLAEGGLLIYETFAAGNARFGKPSSAAFLLQPGELLGLALAHSQRAHGLRVLAYEDGYVNHPRPAMVQRICVVKASAVEPTALALD